MRVSTCWGAYPSSVMCTAGTSQLCSQLGRQSTAACRHCACSVCLPSHCLVHCRYVPASQPAGSVHMAAPSSSGGHADLPKYAPPHQRSSAEAPEVASTLAACSVQLQNLMRMLLQYGPNMSQVKARRCAAGLWWCCDDAKHLTPWQPAQCSRGISCTCGCCSTALCLCCRC